MLKTYHRVHKANHEAGEEEVGSHLASLRDSAGDNRRNGAGERELEEPCLKGPIVKHEEEICITDESSGAARVVSAVRKRPSNSPVGHATAT